MSKFKVASICLIITLSTNCSAKCVLPSPDGNIDNVTNRNIAGYFIGSSKKILRVSEYKSERIVEIDLKNISNAYSAFGGDLRIAELTVEVPIRVWLRNCRFERDGRAVAAYVEFYSNDLNDKPPNDYFEAPGQ